MNKNTIATTDDKTSATTIDNQIPLTSKINGNNNIDVIWNNKVLKKEINAEVTPSFNAVKNPDVKMLIPANKKQNDEINIAFFVISNNSSL